MKTYDEYFIFFKLAGLNDDVAMRYAHQQMAMDLEREELDKKWQQIEDESYLRAYGMTRAEYSALESMRARHRTIRAFEGEIELHKETAKIFNKIFDGYNSLLSLNNKMLDLEHAKINRALGARR